MPSRTGFAWSSAFGGPATPPAGSEVAAEASIAASTAPVVLRAEALRKTYRAPGGNDTVALDDVSFELRRSEILGVVGESGSGKSTAARLVLGLTEPDSGGIEFLGERGAGSPSPSAERAGPGSSTSRRTRWARSTRARRAGAIVSDALARVGVPARTARRRGRATADECGTAVGCRGPPPRLALRRAAPAGGDRAGAGDPARTSSSATRRSRRSTCRSRRRCSTCSPTSATAPGVALLFISHDLGVIHHIADRVLVMKDGRIVERGDVENVFTAPQHPYTQQLLASLPALPHRERASASRGFGAEPHRNGSTERIPHAQD